MKRGPSEVIIERSARRDELSKVSWSALVAIGIAKRDNKINSKMAEHLFIMKWLAVAKKRKVFSKSVVKELHWLIDEGKQKSVNANLKFRLEYLYYKSSDDKAMHNSYFKLTRVIEKLKKMGWKSFLLTPKQWGNLCEINQNRNNNHIFMDEVKLQRSFGNFGEITEPFYIRVDGDIDGAKCIFEKYELAISFLENTSDGLCFFHFKPEQ
ncbi:DUF2913 family protein [Salmonella enterica]|nr:DUF2913 family protein [Salmonella enterica subsp. enterica serovar Tennessee]EIA9363477.1 DUF2913 family protein [Salmonella enterica]HDP0188248.1 DUF2913 family protein [Salmonella enterica subsp. enterica serovar Concord]